MITVVFKKRVAARFGSSSDDVWLSHVMELPFVPPIDMEVCDGDWTGCVVSLCYSNDKVFAFTDDDRELHHRPGIRPIEDIVLEYVDEGWAKSNGILCI